MNPRTMTYRILAINPGSTSTKIALYDNETEVWRERIEHSHEELSRYDSIAEQAAFRKSAVLKALEEHDVALENLSAVVGRGGLLPPIKAGGYIVNAAMREYLLASDRNYHASNLGALIADDITRPLGLLSYIYDAVSADELQDVARITGLPEAPRPSFCHVLNTKAMGRKVAERMGKRYEDVNFIITHLGGGITQTVHRRGRIVDILSDDGGPFSPERAGAIPLRSIIEMCFSGKYTIQDMFAKLRGQGGIRAHLGVHDCREVERMIDNGDAYAKLVYEAQAYQIAKGIGLLSPVLTGEIDAIIITGGIAHSERLTGMIKRQVEFLGPVVVMPGENELESLSLGVLRILRGDEAAHIYDGGNLSDD